MPQDRPLVISSPWPRTLDLIFGSDARQAFEAGYKVREIEADALADLPDAMLKQVRYIVGQPPIDAPLLEQLGNLRAVFNVETNLIDNMPYPRLFERGIHVLTTGAVFARPVAEMGLGLALDLARQITDADLAFREGREQWGGDGNEQARLLSGADIAIVGFGDLGRALARLLEGFRPRIRIVDPWVPPSVIREAGAEPVDLGIALEASDVVFVTASVTSENEAFLGADAFARMRRGASFVLLSRAGVVDFDALMDAVESGHIRAASDVFPDEPPAPDDRIRQLDGFLRSAHRAGALDVAFKQMGDMVLEDMDLMDRGLPPQRCKRAERETVARMRSAGVIRN